MVRSYAGIAAPLIVMIVLLIQGVMAPAYDPIRQTISELGTGWGGTRVVSLYGVIVLICVWEPISKRLAPSLAAAALTVGLVLVGLGCFGLGMVDAESGSWNSMTWRGRLHLIFAFGFIFAAIPVACFAAARALPAASRALRTYSWVAGLACLTLFIATLIALSGSPPDPYAVSHLGVIERVYVFAFMIWQCIVSASLTRSLHRGG